MSTFGSIFFNRDESVWPAVARAGVDRSKLLLAFSYHTTSRSSSLGRFEKIRDAALASLEEAEKPQQQAEEEEELDDDDNAFTHEISSVEIGDCSLVSDAGDIAR